MYKVGQTNTNKIRRDILGFMKYSSLTLVTCLAHFRVHSDFECPMQQPD